MQSEENSIFLNFKTHKSLLNKINYLRLVICWGQLGVLCHARIPVGDRKKRVGQTELYLLISNRSRSRTFVRIFSYVVLPQIAKRCRTQEKLAKVAIKEGPSIQIQIDKLTLFIHVYQWCRFHGKRKLYPLKNFFDGQIRWCFSRYTTKDLKQQQGIDPES